MKRKPSPPSPIWHALEIDEAFASLDSTLGGLTTPEADRRLAKYGFNEIEETGRVSALTLLLDQFKNVLILILLVATGLSGYLGHEVEAAVIAVIVLFSVILGFVQEYRAGKAMEALRNMAAPMAVAIRDGEEVELPARRLVPGDVIRLQTGDRVPADARLIQSVNLQCEEASLTGESLPVEKQSSATKEPDLALGDRKNMVYAGTSVSYGRGFGLVVATGMNTEFGRIVGILGTAGPRATPLQQSLDKVGGILAIVGVLIVAAIA
ncbi:MAG TPA: HAD-IC family P-type ATPase, partial [Methylococcaceae bacterium]|nr:HAD-IC family P-type ATPase [Methylococcaceae bacterium]